MNSGERALIQLRINVRKPHCFSYKADNLLNAVKRAA
jgi:hypothetical protein